MVDRGVRAARVGRVGRVATEVPTVAAEAMVCGVRVGQEEIPVRAA
jgi:hypothetical protein